jgi:type IV secretion system protein VirD4
MLGQMMLDAGYVIKVLNVKDFSKSMHYNPLAYIEDETDILKFAEVLLRNTRGKDNDTGDPFWDDAERLIIIANTALVFEVCKARGDMSEFTLPRVLELVALAEEREGDPKFKSYLDRIFDAWRQDCEALGITSFAISQYDAYKTGTKKTLQSVLISHHARLAPFKIPAVRALMEYDELELDKIGDRRTLLALAIPERNHTFEFLTSMLFDQMFSVLADVADRKPNKRHELPVQFLMDEFFNIGKIPDFPSVITTIRSRNMSCIMFLQSLGSLEARYKDEAAVIIDACASFVYMGGVRSAKSAKEISDFLGETTVRIDNLTEAKGQGHSSINHQIASRALYTPSEISALPHGRCIVMLAGMQPLESWRYDTAKHPAFGRSGYADDSQRFSYSAVLRPRCLAGAQTARMMDLEGGEDGG